SASAITHSMAYFMEFYTHSESRQEGERPHGAYAVIKLNGNHETKGIHTKPFPQDAAITGTSQQMELEAIVRA
ncbi:hypothetical protein NHQ30_007006, partial [Ciborinia camelliae]